ncbi:sulfatase family protein [Flavilitoribacter nigricans]|uniref:N-acetylgalactosamine-6-sulfatase n=1 Tax=Flavilitoribacter nigricans (strain ATCC 23147 / DSM 23189 / NBRC 102662 / NCIMB 1420 / SS-2) TaxID=1122177 RepID=A0A2D0N1F1_FLAN2|nr:sulfatase-like hydrolase/transferase [Flavilitoribacter nigricans]PHN02372.1 N-acetylgalactosamine-6-sulfatase [Flavilitoribacter nigricans DSM 23189 = NBRC 102662]
MRSIYQFAVLTIFTLLASCAGNSAPQEEVAEQSPPNFILLMGDDHGWDETGYNGHPHVQTPVLDEMSKLGLRMDNFRSGHPSCSPTRGSFITGRHPNRYGTFSPGFSIRPEEISVAQLLGQAGYTSAHFGKWHLGPVKSASPTNPGAMGFQEWLSHDNFFEIDPMLSRNGGAPQQFQGESSELMVEEAIRFIEKANKADQAFFVVIWYGSPHEPYSGLEEDLALYDNLPEAYTNDTVRLTSNTTGEQVKRPLREVLRERYAEITAMDRSIGVLRDFLKEKGLKDNTLLWYCGDNGTPRSAARTGMTLRGEKGDMYEGGIRVPSVMEWPARIKSGSISRVNSVTSDILPTLCEVTGQPVPERPLDGVSLLPMIDGTMEERPSPLFFWSFATNKVFGEDPQPYIEPQLQEGTLPLVKKMNGKFTRDFKNFQYPEVSATDTGGARTIIDNRYKLVLDEQPEPELFDMIEDRAETTNLADAHPEIVEKMQQQLYDWQQSVLKSLAGNDYH